MPLQLDELGLRLIGNNFRGLKFYDDNNTLQAEIYLDNVNRLNIGGVVIAGASDGGSGSSGSGGGGAAFPSAAPFLLLATDTSLSNERVFTPGSGLTATDGGAGGAYTLAVDTTVVRTTRQVATGASLSGGGDLSADRTLSLNLGNANTWSALQTFGAGVAISGANTLTFGGDAALSRTAANVLALATGDFLRSTNFSSGVSGWSIAADGSAEFENVRIRGELATTVLKFNEMQATAGTLIVSKSAGVLNADATTPASIGSSFTLNVKDSDAGAALFAVNDVLWIKTWTGAAIVSIYCTVTAVGAPSGGARNYTCTLNSGSTSTTVRAGTAVADYGPSGAGAITLSADGAVGSSANISIVRHTGSPWSSQTLLARLGNLNGSYGQTLDANGLGLGDYSGGNYLYYDNLRGFAARFGSGGVGIDGSGIRLIKGNGASIGAIKFYDADTFTAQVGALFVDRTTSIQAQWWTDATAFDQYASTGLAAIGDTAAANSRRETYLDVDNNPWGVLIYQGGSDAANGGGLHVSATDSGQVGVIPRGTVHAQVSLRVGSWSAGTFTSAFTADSSGNVTMNGWVGSAEPMRCSVRNSANISLTTSTWGLVTFDQELKDTYAMHSTVTNTSRVTIPTGAAGSYRITANMSFASNATGYRIVGIKVNANGNVANGTMVVAEHKTAVSGDRTTINASTEYELSVGDVVEVFAWQNSGGALNLEAVSDYSPRLTVTRIS